MPSWLLIVLGIVVTGLFLFPAAWLWLGRRHRHRRLRKAITSRILAGIQVTPGLALLEGTSQAVSSLNAPISSEPCIGYALDVSVFVSDTDGGAHWDLANVQAIVPFELIPGETAKSVAVDSSSSFLWLNGQPIVAHDSPLADLPVELQNRILAQAQDKWGQDRPDVIPGPKQAVRIRERLLRHGASVVLIGEVDAQVQRIGPRDRIPLIVLEGTKSAFVSMLSGNPPKTLALDRLERLLEDSLLPN